MFKCVACGYQNSKFNVKVIGPHEGAHSYVAKCPQCGSLKVNTLPGYWEEDVRIGAKEPTFTILNILPTPPKEGPPLPRGLGVGWPYKVI